MPLQISTFPNQPSSLQTVTLGGVSVRLRLTWRQRMQAWYLDMESLSGTPMLSGARLSPGWGPGAGLMQGVAGAPDGIFYVRGQDGYSRMDLGVNLILEWVSRAELEGAAPASSTNDGLTVTL
jgi:hypothetical protein